MRKARQYAFTLIELLATIAIIAVLLALLMPSLKKARETAHKTVCGSNQRQLAIAMTGYNNDFKGCYPYAWNYQSTLPTEAASNYVVAINYYLGQYKISTFRPKVLWCPANPWIPPIVSAAQGMSPTYGLNGGIIPFTGSGTPGGPVINDRLRDREIRSASQVLLMGETPAAATGATDYGASVAFTTSFWTSPTMFRAPYSGVRPLANAMWYDLEVGQGGSTPVARTNHQQGWNSLMCDGSVRYTSRTTLITTSGSSLFWSNQ